MKCRIKDCNKDTYCDTEFCTEHWNFIRFGENHTNSLSDDVYDR